jgi:hypothetical protein
MKRLQIKLVAAAAMALAAASAGAANIVLNNVDPPGVGFNDTTPATPEGGNTGTTVGAQRLIAYQKALELWGKTLKSNVTIVVRGSFAPLTCTASGGTLAQAGAIQIFSDFPNAPLAGHWYGVALANSIAGEDLAPGPLDPANDPEAANDDIIANFNGKVGQPDCIAGPGWYYGLDNNATGGRIDFLDTFMHEVAHGLGFQNFANEATGSTILGLPDVYMAHTLDLVTGKLWNTMNADEIKASAVRNGKVVWNGSTVTTSSALVLGPYQGLRVTGSMAKELEYGTASFGAALTPTNFKGAVALATDGSAAGTLACGPIANAAEVAGKIALVDRGTCGFAVKAKNVQNAGAIGVIVANNNGGPAIGLGGSDPTITIPAAGISAADGAAIKAALPGVNAEFFSDPTRRAGSTDGFVRLYAPPVVALGSSISHFDTAANPNLLMEPSITPDLKSAHNTDLTPALMKDVGWQLETLKVGNCDSGVVSALANGELLHANVSACAASSKNKGAFASCMAGVTGSLVNAGLLSSAQKDAVMTCVARGTP